MSKDFEQQLRDALRPVDPEEGFDQRVMARIANESARPRAKARWAMPIAIAASLAFVAVLGTYQWQERREQQGLEARRQLLEALRLTGEKLDVAYQAVNRESPPPDDGNGA
jgi:negative regulator of sigma E activity